MGRRQEIDNAIEGSRFLAIGAFPYVEGGARSRLFGVSADFLASCGRGVWSVSCISGFRFALVDRVNFPNGEEVLAET